MGRKSCYIYNLQTRKRGAVIVVYLLQIDFAAVDVVVAWLRHLRESHCKASLVA